jgi:RsmE family RNA methyltransferase
LFVAHETATDEALMRAVPPDARALSVVVGPEGGLAESEVERLVQHEHAIAVSLGPRILRAETAAITAVALVMAATENLAPARERVWREIQDR